MPKTNSRGPGLKKGMKHHVLYLSQPDQADRICSGCETCQLMCSLQNTGAFSPKKSRIKVVPLSVGVSVPVTCQQCEDPWCERACPEKAIAEEEIRLKLFPPLSDAAGASEFNLILSDSATLKTVVDALVTRFGSRMKQHLFDRSGQIIPSWAVFLNQKIFPLNQPRALEVPVHPQDEVSFILNIASG